MNSVYIVSEHQDRTYTRLKAFSSRVNCIRYFDNRIEELGGNHTNFNFCDIRDIHLFWEYIEIDELP